MDLCSIIVISIIICVIIYVLFFTNNEYFENTNSDNNNFNLFLPPKLNGINLALTGLNIKLRAEHLYKTISQTPYETYYPKTPILMLSGLGDSSLYYNNKQVWPPTCSSDSVNILVDKQINLQVANNEYNYFSSLIDLLNSSNYSNNKSYTLIPYDFTKIMDKSVLTELFIRIRNNIENMVKLNNKKAVLVGYQLGATLLLLFLNRQQEQWVKSNIDNLVLVGSIIGGSITSLDNYINGFNQYNPIVLNQIDGLKLLLPNYYLYDDRDIIEFNGVKYSASNYNNLLSSLNLNNNLDDVNKLVKEIFKVPKVNITFINGSSIKTLKYKTYSNEHDMSEYNNGSGFQIEADINQVIEHYKLNTNVDVLNENVHSVYLLENYNVMSKILNLLKN